MKETSMLRVTVCVLLVPLLFRILSHSLSQFQSLDSNWRMFAIRPEENLKKKKKNSFRIIQITKDNNYHSQAVINSITLCIRDKICLDQLLIRLLICNKSKRKCAQRSSLHRNIQVGYRRREERALIIIGIIITKVLILKEIWID